jgi:hypothetical protein
MESLPLLALGVAERAEETWTMKMNVCCWRTFFVHSWDLW